VIVIIIIIIKLFISKSADHSLIRTYTRTLNKIRVSQYAYVSFDSQGCYILVTDWFQYLR